MLATLFLAAACDAPTSSAVAEKDEKHFQRGQRLLREGRQAEALAAFLKVIEKRPDAAESHLEAGILYQQHVGDPVASIYHLRRYRDLQPETPEAEKAKQMIESARKDFARSLPGQPYNSAIDRLDLLEMLEVAREENQELKRQLAALRQQQSAPAAPRSSSPASSTTRIDFQSTPRTSAPSAPRSSASSQLATSGQAPTADTRQYTVVTGDTLTRISTKVYGNSGRWQDIFEANRDQLPNPNALRVGQQLRIPE